MTRFMGALILIRTFALPILVIATIWTVQNMVNDVLAKTVETRAYIDLQLDGLEDDLVTLAGDLNSAQETVTGSFGRVARFLNQIDFDDLPLPSFTIPTNISLQVPTSFRSGLRAMGVPFTNFNLWEVLNDVSINIPFAAGLNSIPIKIEDAFQELENSFSAFASMAIRMDDALDRVQLASQGYTALQQQVRQILLGIGKIGGTPWLQILRLLGIAFFVFIGVWYVTTAYEDARKGWRMMTGQA